MLGYVIDDHDRIVDHHSDAEHQTRQRDDIDRNPHQVESQQRHDKSQRNGYGHQERGPQILHEQEQDQTGQQSAHNDVAPQVIDRIGQQLGLVAGNRKLNVGILRRKVPHQVVDLRLQIAHPRIRLLDDSERDRLPRIGTDHALLPLRMLDDLRQILELVQTSVQIQIDVLNILLADDIRFETDVILILPVPYGQIPQFDVVALDGLRERLLVYPQRLEFLLVRNDQQFRIGHPADIHHCDLRDLLDPAGNHLFGKTRHLHKSR